MRSSGDAWNGGLCHLREQGLVVAKTVTINREPIAIIVLTRDGKSLLDAHQERAENGRRQEFTPAWSSLVSWRTTPNSIVSFRQAARIEAEGATFGQRGPVCAGACAYALSKLAVWWLRLRIELERTQPAIPSRTAGMSACT